MHSDEEKKTKKDLHVSVALSKQQHITGERVTKSERDRSYYIPYPIVFYSGSKITSWPDEYHQNNGLSLFPARYSKASSKQVMSVRHTHCGYLAVSSFLSRGDKGTL